MDEADGTTGTFILFRLESVVNLIATMYSRMSRPMREIVRNRLQQIDREDDEDLMRPGRSTRDRRPLCGRQCMFCSRGTCSFNEGHHNWNNAVCLCGFCYTSARHRRKGLGMSLSRKFEVTTSCDIQVKSGS